MSESVKITCTLANGDEHTATVTAQEWESMLSGGLTKRRHECPAFWKVGGTYLNTNHIVSVEVASS